MINLFKFLFKAFLAQLFPKKDEKLQHQFFFFLTALILT